jgi:hypothetical protein
MDRQLQTRWPNLLNGIARQLNPIHAEIFRKHPISYYWSTYQHEGALDVVFHHAADLRHFYPRWVNHAMTTFSSPDVMRFLGKRAEGVRVKHSVNRNSVKLYDKAYTAKGCVLRAEATFHTADDFRVYRRKEGPQRALRLASTAPGHCRLTTPSSALPQSRSTVSGRFRYGRRHHHPRPTAPAAGTTTAMARPSGTRPPSLSR